MHNRGFQVNRHRYILRMITQPLYNFNYYDKCIFNYTAIQANPEIEFLILRIFARYNNLCTSATSRAWSSASLCNLSFVTGREQRVVQVLFARHRGGMTTRPSFFQLVFPPLQRRLCSSRELLRINTARHEKKIGYQRLLAPIRDYTHVSHLARGNSRYFSSL